jgi:hypothetical protein
VVKIMSSCRNLSLIKTTSLAAIILSLLRLQEVSQSKLKTVTSGMWVAFPKTVNNTPELLSKEVFLLRHDIF